MIGYKSKDNHLFVKLINSYIFAILILAPILKQSFHKCQHLFINLLVRYYVLRRLSLRNDTYIIINLDLNSLGGLITQWISCFLLIKALSIIILLFYFGCFHHLISMLLYWAFKIQFNNFILCFYKFFSPYVFFLN